MNELRRALVGAFSLDAVLCLFDLVQAKLLHGRGKCPWGQLREAALAAADVGNAGLAVGELVGDAQALLRVQSGRGDALVLATWRLTRAVSVRHEHELYGALQLLREIASAHVLQIRSEAIAKHRTAQGRKRRG